MKLKGKKELQLDYLDQLTHSNPKLFLEIASRTLRLDLSNKNLKDLNGIELFWNLGYLDLSHNPNIRQLARLRKLKKLNHLNLSGIKDIPPNQISYIVSLKELMLKNCDIKDKEWFFKFNLLFNKLDMLDIRNTPFSSQLRKASSTEQKWISNNINNLIFKDFQSYSFNYDYVEQPITHYTALSLKKINPIDPGYKGKVNRKIKLAVLREFVAALESKGQLDSQIRVWRKENNKKEMNKNGTKLPYTNRSKIKRY